MSILLSREQFREQVFNRDSYRCIVCREPAVDAHHIIDRSLWEDGGYYVDNGVSLCENHHLQAEYTSLSCSYLRSLAGIVNNVYPEHFYQDEDYDHWGNIVKPDGTRIKGEAFSKPHVKELLEKAGVLDSFSIYVKFPRTYHFPWSPNLQNDDRMLTSVSQFEGREVVGTVKKDGENCSMYSDFIHARSIDSKHHDSRSWVKAFHNTFKYLIPNGYRVCGENLYAEHSIHYNHLESYFLMFSIWNDNNICLSWDDTEEWAQLLGLKLVPVFYRGVWNKDKIEEEYIKYCNKSKDTEEGYVVRITDELTYGDYRKYVAKSVRHKHVNTDEHWMTKKVIPNGLE